jgi:hypothetical protein
MVLPHEIINRYAARFEQLIPRFHPSLPANNLDKILRIATQGRVSLPGGVDEFSPGDLEEELGKSTSSNEAVTLPFGRKTRRIPVFVPPSTGEARELPGRGIFVRSMYCVASLPSGKIWSMVPSALSTTLYFNSLFKLEGAFQPPLK